MGRMRGRPNRVHLPWSEADAGRSAGAAVAWRLRLRGMPAPVAIIRSISVFGISQRVPMFTA